MASFLSRLFKTQKQEIQPQMLETPEQLRARTTRIAMPSLYGQIEPLLSQYLAMPESRLIGLGGEEIEKTLTEEYDPYASPYYKSLRRGLEIEKERGTTSIRQSAQQAGMWESLGRLIEEARLTGGDVGAAGDILAQLQWQERQNRLGVLPYAMQYGQYAEQKPLRELSAIASYAGLPAEWEKGEMTRQAGYSPYYYPMYSEKPSYLTQAAGAASDIGQIISLLMMASSSIRYKKNIKLWAKH